MANNRNEQRGRGRQEEGSYPDGTNWRGQSGGQWGEDIHDTPYNTSGGGINTQTNYAQGNYDYSRPGDYGFDQGNQYGPDSANNERSYSQRRQQSSFPDDSFAERRPGNEGIHRGGPGQHSPNSNFIQNTSRNAAYDDAQYRSRGQEGAGRATYGGGGPNSRRDQPGLDHGNQFQNSRGQYQARQGSYGGDTSHYVGQSGAATNFRGKGPKGYTRFDERIQDDVHDRLTDDDHLDASDIEVTVQNGEITLAGYVESRQAKRHAEDLAESVSGVRNVENRLRVRGADSSKNEANSSQSGTGDVQQQADSTSNKENAGTTGAGRPSRKNNPE